MCAGGPHCAAVGAMARDAAAWAAKPLVWSRCRAMAVSRPARLSKREAALGHVLSADRNALRGDFLSFLFFHETFTDALMRRGQSDAEGWLADLGDGDPWRYAPPSPSDED